MIKLQLLIIGPDGREHYLIDYLMEAMMFKLKHFCDAVGLEAEYNEGSLMPAMCEGKYGKVKIIIDEPEEDSPFNPKNAVKDYVKRPKEAPPLTKEEEEFFNDDLKI